jgi:hypothetical protein
VAALVLERSRVDLSTGDFDEILDGLPSVLQTTVQTLQAQAANATEAGRLATRALRHLYQIVQKEGPR